jgi:hypothetical protein
MSRQPIGLTRRQVLLGALSAFIVGCSDAGRYFAVGSQSDSARLRGAWPKLIADPAAAARLGRIYLAAHPEYQTADSLLSDIEQSLFHYDAEAARQGDSDRVAKAIKGLVSSEYKRDDVVSLSGWIVSATEARLYGLAAMGAI